MRKNDKSQIESKKLYLKVQFFRELVMEPLLFGLRIGYGTLVVRSQNWLWNPWCSVSELVMEPLIFGLRIGYGTLDVGSQNWLWNPWRWVSELVMEPLMFGLRIGYGTLDVGSQNWLWNPWCSVSELVMESLMFGLRYQASAIWGEESSFITLPTLMMHGQTQIKFLHY
jgi:hypothetical protein